MNRSPVLEALLIASIVVMVALSINYVLITYHYTPAETAHIKALADSTKKTIDSLKTTLKTPIK